MNRLSSVLIVFVVCLGAAATATCVDTTTIECPSGIVCPEGTQCAAAQPVCIRDDCGNAGLDSGEICDDGNIMDGDGCSANCQSDETCGNGVRDEAAGEVCDDGDNDSGDGCSSDCKSDETCGNDIKDVDEVCDDGNTDNGDGCAADCQSAEGCGNDTLDVAAGEVCDDGNTVDGPCVGATPPVTCSQPCSGANPCPDGFFCSAIDGVCDGGDGCSSDCKSDQTCGNDHLDTAAGELCDDGENLDGDGCSADCLSLEVCGNSIVDGAIGEVCDDGNTSDGPCAGASPPAECAQFCDDTTPCPQGFRCVLLTNTCDGGDGCSGDCHSGQGCGNGNRDVGEECDDGNVNDEDNCKNDCTLNICGDAIQDFEVPRVEQCDDGGPSADCNADCTLSSCGDTKVNAADDEECDNGSTNDSSTCDGDCTVAFCGDAHTNSTTIPAEQCDTAGPSSGCDLDCTTPSCGDGVVNPFFDADPGAGTTLEQCDDAGQSSTCDADCTVAFCGDNTTNAQTVPAESCDTGGNSATCDRDCSSPSCGDGLTNTQFQTSVGGTLHFEQCDTSGASSTCDGDCTIAFCGDGTTNGLTSPAEACDTGGNSNTCDANCTTPSCGDAFLNPQFVTSAGGTPHLEQCDPGATATATCDTDCTFAFCGDGTLNGNTVPAETCDTGGNSATCDADCSAPSCGDSVVNPFHDMDPGTAGIQGEQCEDGNSNPADGCNNCRLTFCGDGITQSPEACDDGNNVDGDGCRGNCSKTEVCGDGVEDPAFTPAGAPGPEQCDLGGSGNGDLICDYGNATCAACTTLCQDATGTGNVCGDGSLDAGHETCDDHNTNACGACSASCGAVTSAFASGTIVSLKSSDLAETDTFKINDGINAEITFKFDKPGGSTCTDTATLICVQIGSSDGATTNAGTIRTEIEAVGATLLVGSPSTNGSVVNLRHDRKTSLGNQNVTEQVADTDFSVTGMTGGAGGNCAGGSTIGCSSNDDCASNQCVNSLCL